MTDRLGLQRRSELTPEAQEQYDAFERYTDKKYDGIFRSRDEQGRFLGPFGILLHTPQVAAAYLPMSGAIGGITQLDADVREVAILVVGARTGAKYETYAHERVSGFDRATCNDILAGRCPESFDVKCKVAYDVATALSAQSGPLPEHLWKEANKVLGREKVIALVHYIGFYAYIAVLLNAFDASVPE